MKLLIAAAIGMAISQAAIAAAPKMPSDEDVRAMFVSSDAFVRVCRGAMEFERKSSPQLDTLAMGCAAFAQGVGQSRQIASKYEVLGQPVCVEEASGRAVIAEAFSLYDAGDFEGVNPAALLLAAQARIAPCK